MKQVVGAVGEMIEEKERDAGWEAETKCTEKEKEKTRQSEIGRKWDWEKKLKEQNKARKQKDTR